MIPKTPFSASKGARLMAAGTLLFGAPPAGAAPRGGVVTSGTATVEQAGTVTNIDQASDRASIDWQAFSIEPGETVHFDQPSASSVTLNRVVGTEASVISGVLQANGQVFLINANGVLFAEGSQVNTAGLVASTLALKDQDFQKGSYAFEGKSARSIVNQGTLTAEPRGYVALIGRLVRNEGVILATRGTVGLASGEKVTLNFHGNSLFGVSVDQGTLNALVENRSAIKADGGKVLLTAKAADKLLSAQVNNSGIIQARTLGDLTGQIALVAHGGVTHVDGTLDASAPDGGNGGFIETSGSTVDLANSAVSTFAERGAIGTWLIDADGFTIASSGGDLTGARLSSDLRLNNVTLTSTSRSGSGEDGNIHVNDAIIWSSNTTLTLSATHDIYVNAPVTASGASAGLALNFGGSYHISTPASSSGAALNDQGLPVQKPAPTRSAKITLAGEKAAFDVNGERYTLIHGMTELAEARSGKYALAVDLDASAFGNDNAAVIGEFSGTLAGLGHTVSHLTLSADAENVGLIGSAKDSVIRDLGVVDANVRGRSYVGALLGRGSGALRLSGVYSSGTVTGNSLVGGLVGGSLGPSHFESSYSSAEIAASNLAGGLVGGSLVDRGPVSIVSSHATGNVSSTGAVGSNLGGLVGQLVSGSSVELSYASGDVNGTGQHVGGLVGYVRAPEGGVTIKHAFATGDVIGRSMVGGLVGSIDATSTKKAVTATIENTYALGDVTATLDRGFADAGGLLGSAQMVEVSHSHATGDVTLTGQGTVQNAGGLVGNQLTGGTITTSHAEGNVTASESSSRVGGLLGSGYNVSDSYATGDVKGGDSVGGLGGVIESVKNSRASGSVEGVSNVGGLAGQSFSITGSSASGNVWGDRNVGGLVGQMYNNVGDVSDAQALIQDSKATGGVSGKENADALIGARGPLTIITGSTGSGSVSVPSGPPGANAKPPENGTPRPSLNQAPPEDSTPTAPRGDTASGSPPRAPETVSSPGSPDPPGTASKPSPSSQDTNTGAEDIRATAQHVADLAARQMASVQRPPERVGPALTSGATTQPPSLIQNIAVKRPAAPKADGARYSTSVKQIEIDGVGYDLTEERFDEPKKKRKKKKKPLHAPSPTGR